MLWVIHVMVNFLWKEILYGRRTASLHVGEERMLICSIDFQFLEELETGDETSSWSDIFQGVKNFGGVLTRFLQAKLVTGGGNDFKIAETVVQCIQGEVLWCRYSKGCNSHNENNFPLISSKGHIALLVDVHQRIVIDCWTASRTVAARFLRLF